MLGAFALLIVLFGVNQGFFNAFAEKHKWFSKKLMNTLFLYHIFFFGVYYTYAAFNPSDSKAYFSRPQISDNWFEYFGTSTTFLDFISWPFVNFLGFNYEMMMLLFSWFGYLGFVYAYMFFRENIPVKIKVFKNFDFLILTLFLPNIIFGRLPWGKERLFFWD